LAVENSAGIDADLAKELRPVGAVADKSAGSDELAPFVHRRYRMARRQSDDQLAMRLEENRRTKQDRIGLAPGDRRKRFADLVFVSGTDHQDLLAHGARGRFDRRRLLRSGHIVGIDDKGDQLCLWHKLTQQLET